MKYITKISNVLIGLAAVLVLAGCASNNGIDLIFDTDANNEIDDQHAIAYLLLNEESFNTLAITTNVTVNGSIQDQCDEVRRVSTLLNKDVRIIPGATASFEEIAGKGPVAKTPVTGRHGGEFTCFGDYSLNLFENIGKAEDGSRALFDMACVAVVKNPDWCEAREIPSPIFVDGEWVDRPDNPRHITLLENYKGDEIIDDFIAVLSSRD